MSFKRMSSASDEGMDDTIQTTKSNPPTADCLPDEIYLEIFEMLDYQDLRCCSLVSRRWHFLIEYLRPKSLTFKRSFSGYQLRKFVESRFHESLQKFELCGDSSDYTVVSTDTVLDMGRRSPNLRKLVFQNCVLCDPFLQSMPARVRHLTVRDCRMKHFRYSKKPVAGGSLTCLEASRIDPNTCFNLLNKTQHLNNLRYLYLRNSKVVNNEIICSMTDILPHLYILDLEGTAITSHGASLILRHCTAIKELYMGHVCVGDSALRINSVNSLPNLTTLCLDQTYVTSSGIEAFMRGSVRSISILGEFGWLHSRAYYLSRLLSMDMDKYPVRCDHRLSHSCSCF